MCLYCSVAVYTSNLQYLWPRRMLENFVNAVWCFLKKSWGSDFYPNLSLYSTEENVTFQELL